MYYYAKRKSKSLGRIEPPHPLDPPMNFSFHVYESCEDFVVILRFCGSSEPKKQKMHHNCRNGARF